jgi:nitrate/nitrite transport system ATP-binding protein
METPRLEISALSKAFPGPSGPAVIVKDFTLNVKEGEFVSIIGHSGCGKSTVLSIVMGLSEPSLGGVMIDGHEIDGPGTDRGVVFQSPSLFPWLTAGQNVALAAGQARPNLSSSELRAEAARHLAAVGLAGASDRMPDEMSSGMKQRVGIARAFAMDPKVLLLDEPFSLLDALTRMELQDELIRLWEEKRKTVVMVTHDVDEAMLLSDRVVMMTHGPGATIGDILTVPFPRPRRREDVLAHPDYYTLRDRLTNFLESGAAPRPPEEEPVFVPSPYVPTARVQMVPVFETTR